MIISILRKQPILLKAIQWTGDNLRDVNAFTNLFGSKEGDVLRMTFHGANLIANLGDWIVRDESGRFHCCTTESFTATYEPAHCQQS